MKSIPNTVFFEWLENEIAEGRNVRFRVKGVSMFPLLRSNQDEVILSPCKPEDLKINNVVLFRYQGKHILHRIIHIDGDRLDLQGDGSYVAKETCLRSDVVGKVTGIVRGSKKPSRESSRKVSEKTANDVSRKTANDVSEKLISVQDWRWRLASALWPKCGPVRTLLLRILHRLSRA